MKTKTIKLLLIILLPIFLLTNCFTCYANNNVFLNYDFWINNSVNKNNIIIDNNNGNDFYTLTYDYLYYDEFGIGMYINLDNVVSMDEQELLNLKVYYYIKGNENPISAIINNKSQLNTLDETMIKDYGANQIYSNNNIYFMSYIKVEQIDENSLISLYVSANETRYLLADNVPIKSISYNVPTQTTLTQVDITSSSNTNSTDNKDTKNDKTNLKAEKYANNVSVISHEKTTVNNENENSNTNSKKYYNNITQDYNKHNTDNKIKENNNYDNVEYKNSSDNYKDNVTLSNSSKISIVSGTLLTLIGLSITIISVIKNIKTNNNK